MRTNLIYIKKWKIKTKNYTGTNSNNSSNYSIKCLSNVKILESNYNAIFFLIKKFYKKKTYFNYKINKEQTISIKSLGMRMGKGKGKKKKKIYLISKGNFFLELKMSNLRSKKDFKLFIQVLKKKLPFYVQAFYNVNIFLNI